jgi:hypothetical protein
MENKKESDGILLMRKELELMEEKYKNAEL